MSLLDSHLEQISLSAKAISELPFPPQGKFTNALLRNHDITTLIRDTEAHERALFSLHSSGQSAPSRRSTRRGTMFPADNDGSERSFYPRQQSAVARVLGGDMLQEIERSTASARNKNGVGQSGINVEVLLQGAEKLCDVYPVDGAVAKIISLRNRYRTVGQGIAQYETRVSQQTEQLKRMNRGQDFGSRYTSDDEEENDTDLAVTEEDLLAEMQEIRELEARKRALEERVAGMEKDLGGLAAF